MREWSAQMKCLNNMRLIVPSENAKYSEWNFQLNYRYLSLDCFCLCCCCCWCWCWLHVSKWQILSLWVAVLSKCWQIKDRKKHAKIVISDECSSWAVYVMGKIFQIDWWNPVNLEARAIEMQSRNLAKVFRLVSLWWFWLSVAPRIHPNNMLFTLIWNVKCSCRKRFSLKSFIFVTFCSMNFQRKTTSLTSVFLAYASSFARHFASACYHFWKLTRFKLTNGSLNKQTNWSACLAMGVQKGIHTSNSVDWH